MLFLLLSVASFAAGIEVPPLEQRGGGASYAGLGVPLADILRADLTGALGPEADLVVRGSYRVRGTLLELEASVTSREATGGARAQAVQGRTADFVALEQALLAGLLADATGALPAAPGARPSAVPTRDFAAFAAYAEGLAHASAGRRVLAGASFVEAVRADPGFDVAKAAYAGLGPPDEQSAEQLRVTDPTRAAALDAVLVAVPAPADPADPDARAHLALRLYTLHQQQAYCQQATELRAYLDAVGWSVAPRPIGMRQAVVDLMVATGYPTADGAGARAHASMASDAVAVFRSLEDLVFGDAEVFGYRSLVTAAEWCAAPWARTAIHEALADAAHAHGVAERRGPSGLRFAERLAWHSAGDVPGYLLDGPARARMAEIVSSHRGRPRQWLLADTARRESSSGQAETRRRLKRLFRPEEDSDLIAALAVGDPDRLAIDSPGCAPVLAAQVGWATERLRAPSGTQRIRLAALRDAGCFVGFPARFPTPDVALAYVRSAPERARPTRPAHCEESFARLVAPAVPTPVSTQAAFWALGFYYQDLVFPKCVDEP